MAKKNKIPKNIAGIRVPKQVRKSPILRMLMSSPTGRRILADALVAGATAAAGVLARSKQDKIADAGGDMVKSGKRVGNIVVEAMQDAAGAMTHVIGDAARDLLPEEVMDPKGKAGRRARGEARNSEAAH
ncbi:hypothetical protein GCM10007276_30320 [Agaricicola taiwanensis]|uniref:Uncharacterized protein n=1 Tax=Agaricicola taiwanensis TaxID=591372 RepID=A0A8J2YLF2_9RHOB|nr:hypothetical protein [Agaricicola taiwanensis]GGE51205.1 hypothetical protein GCM10007276_30320 [Agaricicola taiwanensis]